VEHDAHIRDDEGAGKLIFDRHLALTDDLADSENLVGLDAPQLAPKNAIKVRLLPERSHVTDPIDRG
jgi:hypothetical protein